MTDTQFGRNGRDPVDEFALGARDALRVLCRGLADVLGSGPNPPLRVSLRYGTACLDVEWQAGPAVPVAEPPAVPPLDAEAVVAPLVGTFYRAPEPGAAPFVAVGDVLEPGRQIGIVEAMKLMNPVVAGPDQRGVVIEILVPDGESVEYGQPLVLLKPVEP